MADPPLVRSPREWWRKRARYEYHDWPTYAFWRNADAPERYSATAIEALTTPAAYTRLRSSTIDKALWQLPEDIHFRFHWDNRALHLIPPLLDAFGAFIHTYYEGRHIQPGNAMGLLMFWDIVNVEYYPEHPDLDAVAHRLLERQLKSPARALRASAIEGLSHLATPTARQLLREFAATVDDAHERSRIIQIAGPPVPL